MSYTVVNTVTGEELASAPTYREALSIAGDRRDVAIGMSTVIPALSPVMTAQPALRRRGSMYLVPDARAELCAVVAPAKLPKETWQAQRLARLQAIDHAIGIGLGIIVMTVVMPAIAGLLVGGIN